MPTSKDNVAWKGWGASDIGHYRSLNEDQMVLDNGAGLFLVSDGMGGVDGGEVASGLIAEHLPKLIKDTLAKFPDLTNVQTQTAVQEDICAINDLVHREGMERGFPGMGATLVLTIVQDSRAYIFHVGDSRCYLLSPRSIQLLTRDHTISENGKYQVLTRVIGMEAPVQADFKMQALQSNQCLLLCTDGLNHMIPDEEIQAAFQESLPEKICQDLITRAKAAGGEDNITVIVLKPSQE